MSAATKPVVQPPDNAFYPLTRDQLAVPAVPLFRLAGSSDSPSANRVPQPHVRSADRTTPPDRDEAPRTSESRDFRPASDFTVAVRTKQKTTSAEKPGQRPRPDVRFAINPIATRPIDAAADVRLAVGTRNGALPEIPSAATARYPYWLVALIQIVVGTLLVILLVKFSQLIRDSSQTPNQSRAMIAPETAQDWPRISAMAQVDLANHPSPTPLWGF